MFVLNPPEDGSGVLALEGGGIKVFGGEDCSHLPAGKDVPEGWRSAGLGERNLIKGTSQLYF